MTTTSDDPDSAVKAMENELSCYICFNLLREPKDLECPHVYCLNCLQDWVGEKPTIKCPECRHITTVPPGGLANLKTNLRLKNMVGMYPTGVEKREGVPICQNHQGERQQFCVTCDVMVCRNCLVSEHETRSQHEIEELKVITKTRKTEMKAKLDQVHNEVKKIEEDAKKLDQMQRQLEAAKEIAKSKVKKRVQEIIEETETIGKKMADCIEKMYEERLKTLLEEKERGKRLKTVRAAAQNIVKTAADHVYIKHHSSLVDKMDKLCIAQHEVPTFEMACLHFDSATESVNPTLLGKLSENYHRKPKLTLIAEFGKFQEAVGIAATRTGLLAVVDSKSEVVNVYREDNGEYEKQFCLGASSDNPDGRLIHPVDIAVKSDDEFHVVDEFNSVKIFSATGEYERKYSIQGQGGCLTTAADDTIVIGGSVIKEAITAYNPDSELLTTNRIMGVTDIATNSKQIAFTRIGKGKLCVLDFESGQGLFTIDVISPMSVCFEEKSNSVLVAGNSKTQGEYAIVQYCNTTGRFLSRLASGLHAPFSMTITHDGKLAVADFKTVKVYSIQ